jgi:hypothetical protein
VNIPLVALLINSIICNKFSWIVHSQFTCTWLTLEDTWQDYINSLCTSTKCKSLILFLAGELRLRCPMARVSWRRSHTTDRTKNPSESLHSTHRLWSFFPLRTCCKASKTNKINNSQESIYKAPNQNSKGRTLRQIWHAYPDANMPSRLRLLEHISHVVWLERLMLIWPL